ncbi:MAG: hypothetical protein H0V35_14185 [Nitrospira sp.]|nr:hypothetical protein [Nitrospira sp.]
MSESPRTSLLLGTSLSVIAASNIVVSFGMQWLTVSRLGIGVQADAFYAGATLPQMVTALMIDPLIFVLIPYFSGLAAHERHAFAWFLLIGVILCSSLIAGTMVIFSPIIVPWFVPGFSPEALHLTVELARIEAIGLVGVACFTVLACFCHSHQRFVWAALSSLSCCFIGWLVLIVGLDHGGVRLAAWIQVFVWGGPALLLLPAIGSIPRFSWVDELERARKLWICFRPLVFSAAYTRSGFVVDRFLTSFLDQGSLVILELASRTLTALVRVLNQGFVTPILPRLTMWAVDGQWERHSRLLRHRLGWIGGASVALFVVIGIIPAWVSAEEIWARWSGVLSGSLGPHEFRTLWLVLLCGSGVLLCGGVHNLLINAFYAEGETWLPARMECVTHTTGLVMKVVGVMLGGLMGIAMAVSLFYVLNTIALGIALRRRLRTRGGLACAVSFLPMFREKVPPPLL